MLEHWALLDVKLEISNGIRGECRFGNVLRIQPKLPNSFLHGDAACVGMRQQSVVHGSCKGSASEKRNAKADALFLGKSDNLKAEVQLLTLQSFDKGDCDDYTQNSVEGAGVRDRVEVGAD